jgi:hypothetical protein
MRAGARSTGTRCGRPSGDPGERSALRRATCVEASRSSRCAGTRRPAGPQPAAAAGRWWAGTCRAPTRAPARRAAPGARRDRERARTRPGFDHPSAGVHVRVHHDRTEILGIDDLRGTRHLQDVVGEPRAEGGHDHPPGRLDPSALGSAEEPVVGERARMRVVRAARFGLEHVRPAPLIHEQDALTGLEGDAHGGPVVPGRCLSPTRMGPRLTLRGAPWAAVAFPASRRSFGRHRRIPRSRLPPARPAGARRGSGRGTRARSPVCRRSR